MLPSSVVPPADAPAVVATPAVVRIASTLLRSWLLLVLRFRWAACGSLEVPWLDPGLSELLARGACSGLVVDVVDVVELVVVVTAVPILLPLEVPAASVAAMPRPADESASAARPSG